jgi:hypothetical protein
MNSEELTNYEELLDRWIAGESLHCDRGHGTECCPDFSCCKPELLQPVEVRKAFKASSPREREELCVAFVEAEKHHDETMERLRAGKSVHAWISIDGVEGYFCSAEYCPRCGTARTGPHGGASEGNRPLYWCEYRIGRTEPVEVPGNPDPTKSSEPTTACIVG